MRTLNPNALAPLRAAHAHIIAVLVGNQFEPGACRWSYQAIADAMRRRTLGPIKRTLKECESLGYLAIERVARPGRGHINVYRIAERFFFPERDSRRPPGKREDSESVSNTESVAARASESTSRSVPRFPKSTHDPRRALEHLIDRGARFIRETLPNIADQILPAYWGMAMRRFENPKDREARMWLNEWLARVESSDWLRLRRRPA